MVSEGPFNPILSSVLVTYILNFCLLSLLYCCEMNWLGFIVKLTKPRVTWEEGNAIVELSRKHWPVAMSVRDCLDVEEPSS